MVQHQPDASLGPAATRRRRFEVAPPQRSRVRPPKAPWFDLESRLCVYTLVASVVRADGLSTAKGDAFLLQLRGKLGIRSEVRRLPADLDISAALRELPRALRYLTLQLGIAAATVDGAVVPAGRSMLEEMAGALRLSKRFVNMRLAQALTRPRTRH